MNEPVQNNHLDPAKLSKVVGVMTTGRAGSGLMSSLLDFHPNIISTPDIVLSKFHLFWEKHCDLTGKTLIEAFIDYYLVLFDGSKRSKCPVAGNLGAEELNFTSMGENRDQTLEADVKTFRKSMVSFLPEDKCVSRRLFFQALHVAYANAAGQKVGDNPVIAFGLHIPHRPLVKALTDDFPNTQFIHMVRDPVKMMGSNFRQYLMIGRSDIDLAVNFFRRSCHSGESVPAENRNKWRAVRLEDLHADPMKTLTALCGWLGIAWNDCLMKSTFNGIKYWNVKGTIQISGFSQEITNQTFDNHISRFDQWRLWRLFDSRYFEFGYYSGDGAFTRKTRQILVLPLILLPLRMELTTFKMAKNKTNFFGIVKAYIALRKAALYLVFKPPNCSPTLF